MINRKLLAAAIACVAAQAAMPVAAEDLKCCFRITPYYWAVGLDGSLEDNRGPTTNEIDFNQDIGDVTDNLDFNGSLMVEFVKDHWANMAQIDYISTDNDDTDINVAGADVEIETDTMLATAATGYRFEFGERSSADLMVGVRYGKIDIEADVKGGPGSADADTDAVDGIVMLRPRIALGRHWAFSPTLSAGAGDSDLVWELAPEFIYTNDCCNLEFRFGYRTVNYEFEENNVDLDFSFAGPMAGIGFTF